MAYWWVMRAGSCVAEDMGMGRGDWCVKLIRLGVY